jgi:hypothetical protein
VKKIHRVLAAAAISVGLVTAGAGAVLAAPSPAPAPTAGNSAYTPVVTVASTTAVQGGAVSLTLDGFLPGEQVEIGVRSDYQKLIVWTVDSSGGVSGSVTLPDDLSVGTHTIIAQGLTSGRTAHIEINVVAKPTSAAGPGSTAKSGLPRASNDVPTS